jgi:hypothetical protein
METTPNKEKVSLKDIFSPLDLVRESESKPALSQIEMELIDNIQKFNALEDRQREIDRKMKEEPLLFFRNLVYEIEYEKINDKKIKLVKYVQGLRKRIPVNSRQAIALHAIALPTTISRGKHGVKYVPLSILNEHKKVRDELTDIQNKLEKLYEQKSIIYQEINNSRAGIADAKTKQLLKELDMIESSLTRREEDLERDVYTGTISTRRSIPEQVTNISLALSELASIRDKEPEEKRVIEEEKEPEQESGLTKEEEEELNEMDEIRTREDDKEIEDELER